MASSGEKLLSLALPALGVLDVLVTTVAYARQGELLSERNPMIANISQHDNVLCLVGVLHTAPDVHRQVAGLRGLQGQGGHGDLLWQVT